MKKILIANWKANPNQSQKVTEYFSKFQGQFGAEVVFCPPFVYLNHEEFKKYTLGAQNCFWENQGSYTGEITPGMLKDLGASYVLIAHSERRNILGETNEVANFKIKQALANGLIPVYCLGEKEGQNWQEVIKTQLQEGLKDINTDIVIAYEPVWAIGTGKACDPATAKQVKEYITTVLGKTVPVLYGGSVNASNASEFLNNMDGLLIGGASLDPEEFAKICSLTN